MPQAFDALLVVLNVSAEQVLAQPLLLQTILVYHVVPTVYASAAELAAAGDLTTVLNNDTLTVTTTCASNAACQCSSARARPSALPCTESRSAPARPACTLQPSASVADARALPALPAVATPPRSWALAATPPSSPPACPA